ncbi:MAG: hypothetical protein MZV49_15700 [Rhodopseudomonas palustris]|nr:hypothetical protein [Rhodopseudomonas palustris]
MATNLWRCRMNMMDPVLAELATRSRHDAPPAGARPGAAPRMDAAREVHDAGSPWPPTLLPSFPAGWAPSSRTTSTISGAERVHATCDRPRGGDRGDV